MEQKVHGQINQTVYGKLLSSATGLHVMIRADERGSEVRCPGARFCGRGSELCKNERGVKTHQQMIKKERKGYFCGK